MALFASILPRRAMAGEVNSKAMVGIILAVVVGVAAFFWFAQQGGDEGGKHPSVQYLSYYPEDSYFMVHTQLSDEYRESLYDWYHNMLSAPHTVPDSIDSPRAMEQMMNASVPVFSSLFDEDLVAFVGPEAAVGQWATFSDKAQADVAAAEESASSTDANEKAEGAETPAATASKAQTPPDILNVLWVAPIVEGTTLEQIQSSVDESAVTWVTEEHQGNTIATTDAGQVAMAIVDDYLWIANSPETVKASLERVGNKSAKSFAVAKGVMSSLAKLPAKREATFVLSTANMAKYVPKPAAGNPAASEADPLMRQLVAGMPVLVGSVTENSESRLVGKFYLPVDAKAVTDKELKTRIESILAYQPVAFKGAQYVPDDTQMLISFADLDDTLRAMYDNMKAKNPQNQFAQMEFLLSSMELDLSKDIIGLFDGEFNVAVHRLPEKPAIAPGKKPMAPSKADEGIVLMTNKTEAKSKTLTTVLGQVKKMIPPQFIKEQQLGSVSATTLQAPGPDKPVGIAEMKDVVVFAPVEELTSMAKINDEPDNTPSLSKNELYKNLSESISNKGYMSIYTNPPVREDAWVKGNKAMDSMVMTIGPSADKSGVEGNFAVEVISKSQAKAHDEAGPDAEKKPEEEAKKAAH